MKTLSLDYLVLIEIKLDESFPTTQFDAEGYEIGARRDWDKYGEALIEFVPRGYICKRFREYGPKHSAGNYCVHTKWMIPICMCR